MNKPLEVCGTNPVTGYYRNGKCTSGKDDSGTHVVCAVMTKQFLEFTKSRGNDLSTPNSYFPGLKPGDRWCLCALRWREAYLQKKAPLVVMDATEQTGLKYSKIEDYKKMSFN